MTIIIKK